MKVVASLKSQLQNPKNGTTSAYFSRRDDYFPKKPLLLSLEAVPFTEQSSLPLLLIILICCECFGAFVHGWCQKTVHSLDLLSIDEMCLASAYMKGGDSIPYSSSDPAIFLNFKLFQSHLNSGPFKFVSHTNFHSIPKGYKRMNTIIIVAQRANSIWVAKSLNKGLYTSLPCLVRIISI